MSIKMQTADKEKRSLVMPVAAREDNGSMTIAGYASVFGEQAQIGDMFTEVIVRGAFERSLQTADVRAYYGHASTRLLGRSSAGTLRLSEDAKGLAVEIDLPDTSDGRDVRALIARGDLSGMSFGFSVRKQEWDFTVEPALRTITEIELHEVSVVSEPAYDGTSIALRSKDAAQKRRNFSAAERRLKGKINLDVKIRSKA